MGVHDGPEYAPARVSPQFITFRIKECPIYSLLSKLDEVVFSDADHLVKSELTIEV